MGIFFPKTYPSLCWIEDICKHFRNIWLETLVLIEALLSRIFGGKLLCYFKWGIWSQKGIRTRQIKCLSFCACVCACMCACVCVCAHNPCTSSLCCLITKAKYKDVNYVCIIHLLKINLNFHLFLHRQWRWLVISCMIYLYREKVTRLHVILRKYVDLRKRICFPAEIFKIIFRHICWQTDTWY